MDPADVWDECTSAHHEYAVAQGLAFAHPPNPYRDRSTATIECGGCAGMGAHRKWCEAAVGRSASFLGKLSERAESLGDTVGPNEMGAANHLWAAAGLLRAEAKKRADEWRARENGTRVE